MTNNRWQRLESLVEAARARTAEERAPFLAEACQDDPALHADVESLLRLEDRTDGFLESPSGDGLAALFVKHDADQLVGRRIGRFELTGVLGYGGMGVVYRAVQENPRREVALKVVRTAGPADRRQLRLYEREVRSLARLRHRSIAAIHEAGSTDDGQHYFAMELVTGLPLTMYARHEGLSRRDRLELFCTICDAVQYAHQRGVIHRDLKPSNILIDADGSPKILDFGLAKITDADVAALSVATEVGKVQGTLSYMSPEQARGRSDDIDSRSDVYSLGVVLYELITEVMPYDVLRTALPEAIRAICEEPPRRPSDFDRTLRGDLETILLKAVSKEPDRRYATAAALSQDVLRYLTDQPIIARPPTATYQLRKLVARHKVPFALLTLILALVLGSGILALVLYANARAAAITARTARTEADRQRDIASAINQFLLNDMIAAATPEIALGDRITVEEVLQQAAEKIEAAFSDQPETEAAIRATIADAYVKLGRFSPAEEQFRAAYAIRRRALGKEHPDTLDAATALATHLPRLGGSEEGEALLRDVHSVKLRLLGAEDPDTLRAKHNLAETIYRSHNAQHEIARKLLLETIETTTEVLGPQSAQLLPSLDLLAEIHMSIDGDYKEAERLFHQVYENRKRSLGEDNPLTVTALSRIEEIASVQGNYAESGRHIRNMLDIRRRTLGPLHPKTLWTMHSLAISLEYQLRRDEAEPLYRETLSLHRQVLGEEHPETLRLMENFADFLSRSPDGFDEAEELLVRVLEDRGRMFGNDSLRYTLGTYALLLMHGEPPSRRDPEKALELALQAEAGLGQTPLLNILASAYAAVEDIDKAVTIQKKQVEILPPNEFPLRTQYEIELIHMLGLQGRHDDAHALLDEVVMRTQTKYGDQRAEIVRSMSDLALLLLNQGEHNLCTDFCRELTLMRLGLEPPEDPMLGQTLVRYASTKYAEEKDPEAEEILRSCLEIRSLAFPKEHRAIKEISHILSIAQQDDSRR